MWGQGELEKALIRQAEKMTHGDDVKQYHHPFGPVVSRSVFEQFAESVSRARADVHKLLFGGSTDDTKASLSSLGFSRSTNVTEVARRT
jgi:1-pyrroline-5-carboxylate dehydrogenase